MFLRKSPEKLRRNFPCIVAAGSSDPAFPALGAPGEAYIAAMEYQPVVGFVDEGFGDMPDQFFFHRQGCGSRLGYQTDPFTDPEHMGVNSHIGLLVDHGSNYIGCFSAHPRKLHQFINGHGYAPFKITDHLLSHTDQVFCFIIRVGYAFDERKEIIKAGYTERLHIRVFFKNGRSGHIHPLVGALSRKDNGHQKLVGAVKGQFRFGHGHVLLKIIDHKVITFFTGHSSKTRDSL